MDTLIKLPSIGPVAVEALKKVGIETPEQLREVGAKEAWLRIRGQVDAGACLHMLQGLEAAVEGIPKKLLTAEKKAELNAFFQKYNSECSMIDGGRPFDWSRASADYAQYRDIYPEAFYQKIVGAGLCAQGQRVLDIGTGTGVLPRNLYRFGAKFTGIDIAPGQIEQARQLSDLGGMKIDYFATAAEAVDFPAGTFDTITACQCFFYFDHEKLAPILHRLLKPGGKLAALYMAWLPFEDPIAGKSEELVLRYNPSWSGCGETRHPIAVPDVYQQYFKQEHSEVFDLSIPFTRESWNGRMKACRGIGASLSEADIRCFDKEHMALLEKIAPAHFEIQHYAAITILKAKE